MKLFNTLRHLAGCVVMFALASQAAAAGLLTPRSAQYTPPTIQAHHVDVTIENGYAVTRIDQVFFNPNAQDIEAVYAFPVPERAAVGEFTYWIDGHPVTGEVVEAVRAREIFEAEKARGAETALVEKNEYRTFETAVYPLRAAAEVRIRLVYLQPVPVDSAVGRYVYPLEDGGVDEVQQAFWEYQDTVEAQFSFRATVRSAYPLDGLRLPQHPGATITQTSPQEWRVEIDNAGTTVDSTAEAEFGHRTSSNGVWSLNQDIVLYWRLQPGLPGAVDLVTYRAPDRNEGTFMLTVTPGDDLPRVSRGRDWIFVLDFSGSMEGKYASLVDGVSRALGQLHPDDRFRIVLFNDRAWEITSGFTAVDPAEIEHYTRALDALDPDNGTNLYAGLQYATDALDGDRLSGIVLVTDGVANVGTTEKRAFLELLQQHDVHLFTFVMGNSANRPLLEGMAAVSDGFAMNISNGDDIFGKVLLAAGRLTHFALRDVDLSVRGVKVRDVTPAQIGSLYRGEQLIVMGHYYGDGDAELAVTGTVGDQQTRYEATLHFPHTDTANPELERLWAFATVDALQARMDYLGDDADAQQALVDIALQYSLVTDHTSMIVVAEEQFEQYQIGRANQQRVELEGSARAQRASQPVANHTQSTGQGFSSPRAYPASGSKGAGSMDPWLLLLLLPLLLCCFARRRPLVRTRGT